MKFKILLIMLALISFNANAEELKIEQPNADISRYSVPELKDLPEDIQKIFVGTKKRLGFVPNVFWALAHKPDELRAFYNYSKVIMGRKNNLSEADKQLIIVGFSGYNGCAYCVMSHSAALRKASGNPTIAERVAINYHEADITDRQKAMVDFAMKLTKNSAAVGEKDFAKLREFSLTNEDIWDIASIVAFFNMSNRLMNFAAVRPDDEFYTMGR